MTWPILSFCEDITKVRQTLLSLQWAEPPLEVLTEKLPWKIPPKSLAWSSRGRLPAGMVQRNQNLFPAICIPADTLSMSYVPSTASIRSRWLKEIYPCRYCGSSVRTRQKLPETAWSRGVFPIPSRWFTYRCSATSGPHPLVFVGWLVPKQTLPFRFWHLCQLVYVSRAHRLFGRRVLVTDSRVVASMLDQSCVLDSIGGID